MPNSGPGVVNNRATESGRGAQVDVWAIEQSIDRGYAVATFYHGDIEPDRPDAAEGIRAYYARGRTAYDWGTIAAWAWGVSRAVDYLVTDKSVDPDQIAVVGHSRNGKAALVAAAFDERIALAVPLQAGCGGTAPSRGKIGESVQQINDHFPHWFNAEFKRFNSAPEKLPFDQHSLIALCAPRPVLLANATEDTWANPAGQFEMLQAAAPVYGLLLGVDALEASAIPEEGKLVDSVLGFYIRPGKHSMTAADWKVFLDFADKHFGKPPGK
jgi:dienelactone hydrolase